MGTESPGNVTNKNNKIGGFVVLGVVALIVGYCSLSGSSEADTEVVNEFKGSDAVVYSQQFVKEKLKAPGTAEFPVAMEDDGQYREINDSTFKVKSYVDSENSVGAKIRTYYSCVMTLNKDGGATCEGLKFVE